MATYYTILTDLGVIRLAEAVANNTPLVFVDLAVGDGNGAPITPLASMTALVNETARVTVNNVEVSPDEPSTVRVEGLIPAATGGFTIREAGLFNADNEMIAIASYPPIYKPVPGDGASVDEYIRILIEYSNPTDAIALTIDPNVIVATRLYVDKHVALFFGDGSDGDAVADGVNTFGWATLTGSVYEATRDIFCENLTITGSGVVIDMHGFRLYVRDTLTTVGGAKISNDGTSPTTNAVGTWTNSGTVLKGGQGAAGRTTDANGSNAASVSAGYGGNGGTGGDSGTGKTGGTGGTVTAPSAARGGPPAFFSPQMLGYIFGLVTNAFTATALDGGGGGGGGAGSGTGYGGAGGNAGGVLAVAARVLQLENSGDLQCAGGNGAAASGGNNGGGGGGGGGLLLVAYVEKPEAIVFANATNCPKGVAGAGNGTGTNGSDGSDGNVFSYTVPSL